MLIQQNHYDYAEIWRFGVVFAAIVEFVVADVVADQSFPFDTEHKLALMEKRMGVNAMETISARLLQTISEFQGCNTAMISATVHIVAELAPTSDQRIRRGLLQLTDYVGPEGGRKGRLTLITQGIIGRCARTGEIETVGFADEKEYLAEMIRGFGFTVEEAERHTKSARSYLAVPLKHRGAVLGVLFFFTNEPQVFPRALSVDRIKQVADSIVDLVKVVGLV
jgi:GAF domain-containing protein